MSNRKDSESNRFADLSSQSIHNHWTLFLIEGLSLIVLGFLAVFIPSITSAATTRWLGYLFLASGTIGLVTTFWAQHVIGFWWSLVSALLALLVGAILVANETQDLYGGLVGWPLAFATVVPMRKVLVFFFLIEGAAEMMFAFEHRRRFSGHWAWMLTSGVIDIILASIIIFNLPGTSAWTMGLLIGINMIIGGSSLMAMGLHARAAIETQ